MDRGAARLRSGDRDLGGSFGRLEQGGDCLEGLDQCGLDRFGVMWFVVRVLISCLLSRLASVSLRVAGLFGHLVACGTSERVEDWDGLVPGDAGPAPLSKSLSL